MLPFELEAISESQLLALGSERWSESKSLDFKRDVPGRSDRDKHELLKDVCGLANADGGDLVYGIEEADGVASSLTPYTGESADELRRRIGQVLDAGLEPRVQGLQMRPIECSGGLCLIVRVPSSFDGPHRYLFNQQSKFVLRNGTHTSEMTYQQLRAAFDRTASLAAQARSYAAERLRLIQSRRTWRPIDRGPVCVVQVVPLAGLAGRLNVDLNRWSSDYVQLLLSDWGGGSYAFNLDGIVIHPGGGGMGVAVGGYVLVARNGAFEAARTGAAQWAEDGQNWIPSTTISVFFREAFAKAIAAAKANGASGPAVVQFALVDVTGFKLGVGGRYWSRHEPLADRPDLMLPEVWIEEVGTADVDGVCRPQLDVLWQSFGLPRCLEYGSDGSWQPRG